MNCADAYQNYTCLQRLPGARLADPRSVQRQCCRQGARGSMILQ